jgi:hypothetical protein
MKVNLSTKTCTSKIVILYSQSFLGRLSFLQIILPRKTAFKRHWEAARHAGGLEVSFYTHSCEFLQSTSINGEEKLKSDF